MVPSGQGSDRADRLRAPALMRDFAAKSRHDAGLVGGGDSRSASKNGR
jgi:hypothetical protein